MNTAPFTYYMPLYVRAVSSRQNSYKRKENVCNFMTHIYTAKRHASGLIQSLLPWNQTSHSGVTITRCRVDNSLSLGRILRQKNKATEDVKTNNLMWCCDQSNVTILIKSSRACSCVETSAEFNQVKRLLAREHFISDIRWESFTS